MPRPLHVSRQQRDDAHTWFHRVRAVTRAANLEARDERAWSHIAHLVQHRLGGQFSKYDDGQLTAAVSAIARENDHLFSPQPPPIKLFGPD